MIGAYLNPRVYKPTKAVWHLKSISNKNWRAYGPFIYKGMRGIPIECSTRREELKLKFGDPPEDLQWGFTLSNWGYWVAKIRNFFIDEK